MPRRIQYTPTCKIEIHEFCDSSENVYAATLYVRLEDNNDVHTHLLVAKTRVAPVKKISLPRLELCGAVLLAKLTSSVIPSLNLEKHDIYFWTDSTIVLAWLKKPPCAWNTFVGNRVSHIVDKVGTSSWCHVNSSDNPADIATRGCSSIDLQNNDLWWHGPTWLREPTNCWPRSTQILDTLLEKKQIKTLVTPSTTNLRETDL